MTDHQLRDFVIKQLDWEPEATSTEIGVSVYEVVVKDGNLALEGEVEWAYQKEAAEEAVKYLHGVRNVFNEIEIKPTSSPIDIEHSIEGALARSSIFGERRIRIEARDGVVTLSGVVRSLREIADAERIAWSTPGVSQVISHLSVSHTP